MQRPIKSAKPDKRGRLAVSKDGDLFAVLPDSKIGVMRIIKITKASSYSSHEEVWLGTGLSGEPLIDTQRLEHDNVLSLFARFMVEDTSPRQTVAVIDFQL